MSRDLTSPHYWADRQAGSHGPKLDRATRWLLDVIEPFLRLYANKRWLELGCSPGHISALLYKRVAFEPFGVDFSPHAHLYVETMARFTGKQAMLFQCDLREFHPKEQFDVVASFGLVEHFSDPQEILDHHYRFCKGGGLIVVSIPHFRYLQWLYHFIFDRRDLWRHNLKMMNLETFKVFSRRKNLEVLFVGYVGKMNFWNVDEIGSVLVVGIRKAMSLFVRGVTNHALSPLLPAGGRLYAPWIVFVGRKS